MPGDIAVFVFKGPFYGIFFGAASGLVDFGSANDSGLGGHAAGRGDIFLGGKGGGLDLVILPVQLGRDGKGGLGVRQACRCQPQLGLAVLGHHRGSLVFGGDTPRHGMAVGLICPMYVTLARLVLGDGAGKIQGLILFRSVGLGRG